MCRMDPGRICMRNNRGLDECLIEQTNCRLSWLEPAWSHAYVALSCQLFRAKAPAQLRFSWLSSCSLVELS
jgi:hypothetical protein